MHVDVREMPKEQVQDEESNVAKVLLVDDPFWGGANCHSLTHLLGQIENGFFLRPFDCDLAKDSCDLMNPYTFNNIVLFNNDHYLAINKPADLRMDGPYPATVLKLLLFYFPPPFLSVYKDNPSLYLDKISFADKHTDVPDLLFKATHQLDYATSGVLLFAKSKPAASIASRAFQTRTTTKEYLALVHGHVSFHIHDIPCLPPQCLDEWTEGFIEIEYRKQRKEGEGADGKPSMPTCAVFDCWKSLQKSMRIHNPKRKKECSTPARTILSQHIHVPDIPLDQVLNMTWREIKSNQKMFEYFELMAHEYNLVVHHDRDKDLKVERKRKHLPPFFRIQGQDENCFYIHLALAEFPNQFEVKADLSHVIDSSRIQTLSLSEPVVVQEDSSHPPRTLYRPALTRCTILNKGEFQGLAVTKVCLQPRTGRRHQLRVHMLSCGHPILGDATYEGDAVSVQPTASSKKKRISDRMCLHAHKLNIPLMEDQRYEFVAPDPFLDF